MKIIACGTCKPFVEQPGIIPERSPKALHGRHIVVTYLHRNTRLTAHQSMKILSSRLFNQDVSQAKRMARLEPVFVTDRGKPTHVLLGIEAFRQLAGQTETVIELLAMEDPVLVEPDWRALGGRSGKRSD
ncbi:type II toxin-antitoxin system Phd/YefM family antitoxin [Sphingomonas sp. CARO-RG-8B-R24-01]|uniref:type II toxin-antitoxin system Phd/YefM family antitoxin n=1 Tax=Sphingomonas sp. CARO-RG-8B-R24-01 TaxID=2914831 RepID=UPI001F55DA89|nr:type II toxin-antitoxin system Phd/YefM family antitoxin [Sphingomonas sp. CARO-RG-8B-R24-01]